MASASINISILRVDQPRLGQPNPVTCNVEAESDVVGNHSAEYGNLKGEAEAGTALI